jgi:hypothetical protein
MSIFLSSLKLERSIADVSQLNLSGVGFAGNSPPRYDPFLNECHFDGLGNPF